MRKLYIINLKVSPSVGSDLGILLYNENIKNANVIYDIIINSTNQWKGKWDLKS